MPAASDDRDALPIEGAEVDAVCDHTFVYIHLLCGSVQDDITLIIRMVGQLDEELIQSLPDSVVRQSTELVDQQRVRPQHKLNFISGRIEAILGQSRYVDRGIHLNRPGILRPHLYLDRPLAVQKLATRDSPFILQIPKPLLIVDLHFKCCDVAGLNDSSWTDDHDSWTPLWITLLTLWILGTRRNSP